MQIGAVGYPTFVYNTNYVSASSLGRVGAISDDVLSSKIGYTGSGENENPLRMGESKDFVGIIASQMAMSRMNAARIMQEPAAEETEIAGVQGQDMTDVQDVMDMPEEIQEPVQMSEIQPEEQAQQLINGIQGDMDAAMLGA